MTLCFNCSSCSVKSDLGSFLHQPSDSVLHNSFPRRIQLLLGVSILISEGSHDTAAIGITLSPRIKPSGLSGLFSPSSHACRGDPMNMSFRICMLELFLLITHNLRNRILIR